MDSLISLLITTHELEMKMCSERSLLTVSTEDYIKLMLAVFWLGDISSGFLIQEVEVMECGSVAMVAVK